ncbi:hypothetical protein LIER_07320 [Lithospermum erythrorhizon]|uniref:Uncharacterized protein n=1 Tax=Lithospermum erythrorhizon TaxID=34254 RepID=A0AAV3P848_LITER
MLFKSTVLLESSDGQKFYSKLAVMRYVNTPVDGIETARPRSEMDCDQSPQPPVDHGKKASASQADSVSIVKI